MNTPHEHGQAIAEVIEFPEYERQRAGEFQNGSGPEGGHDPALVNTEVHINRSRWANDACATDYFKVKLWQGIAYMHYAAKVPARFRIAWEQGASEEDLRLLAMPEAVRAYEAQRMLERVA